MVQDYYRRITDVDIGVVAEEMLGDRITARNTGEILCDCPNHASQSHRSFRVDLYKQKWYCFGCKKGGDVLQLVEFVLFGEVTRGVSGPMPESHRKARAILARKAGEKDLSSLGRDSNHVADVEGKHLSHLRVTGVLGQIVDYYHERLMNRPDALAWVMETYGLSLETIKDLKVGFALNSKWTSKEHGPQRDLAGDILGGGGDLAEDDLIATGALIRTKNGKLMPFFKGRIVFPYWHCGQVVFLIARKCPWTDNNQYESAKYKKLRTHDPERHPEIHPNIRNDYLYNEDCFLTRPKRVIITEGVTDCISLMQAGFPVISPVTVRIKEDDWERIAGKLRGVQTVYICQDNEISEVGLAGAIATAARLRLEGIDTRIVSLPLLDRQKNARRDLAEKYHVISLADRNSVTFAYTAEEKADVERLVQAAKIDVNEYFAAGNSAGDFEGLLASARTPLELAVSELPEEEDEARRNAALSPVLRALLAESPLERKRYLHLIKKRFRSVSIEALEAQIRQLEKGCEEADKKKRRFKGLRGTESAETCREVVTNTLAMTGTDRGPGDYMAAAEDAFLWLKGHGARFFRTRSCEPYMFYGNNVYWMDSPDRSRRRHYLAWLYQEIGLIQVQQGGKVFGEVLSNLAIRDGTRRDPSTWLTSVMPDYTVYFSLNNERNEIAVISPKGVKIVTNGGNDAEILLLGSPKMKAINYVEDVDMREVDRLLWELVGENLTCDPRLRVFLLAWVMCFLLIDFAGTKPMTRFEGGSQSGKTTASKFLTTLIYGEHQQKKSTIAANYSDGAQNPLVCLDNIETAHMSDDLMMFLLTSVTGVANEKRKQGSDTETVIERTKCLINTSGIEPLYGHLEEIVTRMFAVRFDPSFSTCDAFLEAEAMSRVIANRDLLLSAVMQKTALVLRMLSGGAHKVVMKMLTETLGAHGKRRCNDYLALMYLMMLAGTGEEKVAAGLAELSPVFIEQVNLINESAGDTSRESNQIANALFALFGAYEKALEMDRKGFDAPGGKSHKLAFEEKYPVKFDTDRVIVDASARELYSALAKIARDFCLSFGYRSVQQFAHRFANDLGVVRASGFDITINSLAHRRRSYDIRLGEEAS